MDDILDILRWVLLSPPLWIIGYIFFLEPILEFLDILLHKHQIEQMTSRIEVDNLSKLEREHNSNVLQSKLTSLNEHQALELKRKHRAHFDIFYGV